MAVIHDHDAALGGPIRLEGVCPVDDAEDLAALLLAHPSATVDWTACTRMHTAVYQVLLRLRPNVRGTSGDTFVAQWLGPPIQDEATRSKLPPIPSAGPDA